MDRRKLGLGLFAGAVIGGLLVAERKRPLRRRQRKTIPRTIRNLAMGASCAVIVAAIEEPATKAIAEKNLDRGRGLAQKLPGPMRLIGGVLAMDYGFYWWHIATHKVPFLWRFHRIHHLDADMDASTALRFHAADMLVSLPWRLVQVRLAGVSPKGLGLWRYFFNASILFHHANLRLPDQWDERLARIVTTPKMHGIHHSSETSERDSNFTSGISLWDRIHATFREGVRQDTINIGVNDVAAADDVTISRSLIAPFQPTPPDKRAL